MSDKKHEGYHRIEIGLRVEPRTEISDANGDRNTWRQMMGFPEPDAGTNLGPPSLNEDTMYYLTRAEGLLVRAEEAMKAASPREVVAYLKASRAFLTLLRNSLDTKRYDVT